MALSDTFRSKLYISYWVITLSVRLSRDSGVYSVRGLSAITTPAAWVLACLETPSTFLANASSFLTVSSLASSRSSKLDVSACSIENFTGINFASLSATEYAVPITRPTSRIACRASIVPNVTIWATLSLPYFLVTYSITSSRRSSAKSKSISGGVGRSGFMNLSNGILCSNGLIEVIRSAYADSDPATLPLPGPTLIPSFFAQLTKSWTIKK